MVLVTFPGPGEAANIGPSQRQTIYPYLKRWFNIPAPLQEPDDRRRSRTAKPDARDCFPAQDGNRASSRWGCGSIRVAAAGRNGKNVPARPPPLAAKQWAAKLGDVEPNQSPQATSCWRKQWRNAMVEALTLDVEATALSSQCFSSILQQTAPRGRAVVIAVAKEEKRFIGERSAEIEALVDAGIEVCLPDVAARYERDIPRFGPRSTHLRAPDRLQRPMALASVEEMLDGNLAGARGFCTKGSSERSSPTSGRDGEIDSTHHWLCGATPLRR